MKHQNYNSNLLTVRLSQDIRDRLDNLVKNENKTKTQIISELLENGLNNDLNPVVINNSNYSELREKINQIKENINNKKSGYRKNSASQLIKDILGL